MKDNTNIWMYKTESLVRGGGTDISFQEFTAQVLQNQGPVLISNTHTCFLLRLIPTCELPT